MGAQWRRVEEQKPQAEDQAPVIRMDVELVNITCSVRDRNGRLIPNLTKDDFLVREDGKPQVLKVFSRDTDLPLTLGLLVDVSPSQERLIEVEKNAAARFFEQVLRPKDLAFLISFGSEAELLQDLTGSAKLLKSGLDDLRVRGDVGGVHPGPVPTMSQPHGTILYDAVYLAVTDRLRGQVGRKAIVVITDGIDQGSRIKPADALRATHLADTVVYEINYFDPAAYGGGWGFGGGGADLEKIVKDTGGRVFRVSKRHPLTEIFRQIQEELRSQYTLGYTPPPNAAGDGAFRKIEVKTRDNDLKVQARKGYFAVADAPSN